MANFVFNIAKGRVTEMAIRKFGGDGDFHITPLKAAGLEPDATLQNRVDLAEVLANNQAVGTGMPIKTLSVIMTLPTKTVPLDRTSLTANDVTWSAATGDPVGKMIISYQYQGSSAGCPLVALDFAYTPNGNDLQLGFPASGFYQAQ